MLNAAFENKPTLEDEGYKSGSENFNIPTPLRWTSSIHHVSSNGDISFNPSTPCIPATSQSHCKPVHHQLSFSSSDGKESSAVHIPSPYNTLPPQNPVGFAQQPLCKSIYIICDNLEEEEDFQIVALDNEYWITEPIPDRHLCNHEHSQLHSLDPYPFQCSIDSNPTSYQDTLDLSDISDFEDVMTTFSDKDIPT